MGGLCAVTGPIASVVPVEHNKDTAESSGEAKHSRSNAVIKLLKHKVLLKMRNVAFGFNVFFFF